MLRIAFAALWIAGAVTAAEPSSTTAPKPAGKVVIGAAAPDFKIVGADGQGAVELSKYLGKGPVLVRLTCACTGCDAELPSFVKLNDAYKDKGFVTIAVFKDKPELVAKYAKDKTPGFVGGLDQKGEIWKVFETTSMPTNILIGADGKIISISKGCTKGGELADAISKKIAGVLNVEPVNVKITPAPKK